MRRASRGLIAAACLAVPPLGAARAAELLVEWAPLERPVDAYQVERRVGEPGQNFTPLVRVSGTSTAFVDRSVRTGVVYCYRVRGVRLQRTSRASAELCSLAREAPPPDVAAAASGAAAPEPPASAEATSASQPRPDRDAAPRLRPPPSYPLLARLRRVSGAVTLRFTVDAAGVTRDVEVIAAEPAGVFEEAAIEAVRRFSYWPRLAGGVAVEQRGVETEVVFSLLDEASGERSGAEP